MADYKIFTCIVGIVGTNCYLICDSNKKAVLIDPGDEAHRLIAKLEEKGCDLQYILLTHGHFDHILAVNELAKKHKNVPVVVHSEDEEWLYNTALSIFRSIKIDPEIKVNFVGDGDIIAVGESMEFRVIHTPGHTRGSVCYVLDDNIFTGDTLFRDDVGRTDLFGGSQAILERSLSVLRALEGDFKVWAGHGDTSMLSREKMMNPYM